MRLTRRIVIQMAIFSLWRSRRLRNHGLRVHAAARDAGHRAIQRDPQLPETGGLYPRGKSPTAARRSAPWTASHLTDTGVEAVMSLDSDVKIPADLEAEVHSVSAVGEQYVELMPRSGSGPGAEGRRRDPAGPHHGPDRHQRGPGPITNRGLAGDPAGESQDGHRRGLHRGRRPRARSSAPAGQRQHHTGHRRPQEPGPADDLDRPVQAGAGLPDRHRRLHPGVGVESGEHHRASCKRRTRLWQGSCRRGPAPPKRCGHCSTGCGRRCRSCWRTWSASARSPSPTSRASSSCWCCCLRAPPITQAVGVAKRNTKQDYKGDYLAFNLNLNLPPPCTTGFLPPQQQRAPSFEDYPTGRRAMCIAGSRRTRRSMCAAPATCPASPFLANAHRRRRCARATRTTCR